MRLLILALVLAVLHLTCANSQSDPINSDALVNPVFNPNYVASVLTVLHLTRVNSQSGDPINSYDVADSLLDPNEVATGTVGADDVETGDSTLVASNPQEASLNSAEPPQNPASVDNGDAWHTDGNNPAVAANPKGCEADGSQTNAVLRARGAGFCKVRYAPSPEESSQDNSPMDSSGKVNTPVQGGNENPATEQEEGESSTSSVQQGPGEKKCTVPSFPFDLCCDGPMATMVKFHIFYVHRSTVGCEPDYGGICNAYRMCCHKFTLMNPAPNPPRDYLGHYCYQMQ